MNLRPGDVLDFDDTASILVARRVIEPEKWRSSLEKIRRDWNAELIPEGQSSKEFLDELSRPVELPAKRRKEGGPRDHLISDFLIAAHAAIQAQRLAAIDRGFLRRYFEELEILVPRGV